MSKAPSASTLVNSWTGRSSVTMWPLPRMPDQWQPPRQRAANVSSFKAANGRIMIVLIGFIALVVRCHSPALWIQKSEGILTADDGRRSAAARLHPDRMPGDVAAGIASVMVPAGADGAAAPEVSCVETKPGDNREGVAIAGIDRHPTSPAALAVTHEVARGQWRVQDPGAMKGVRDRSGTIVTAVVERPVTAAPDIGFAANGVGGPDRVLHALRRAGRRISDSVPQYRPASPHHGAVAAPFGSPALLRILFVIIILGPADLVGWPIRN